MWESNFFLQISGQKSFFYILILIGFSFVCLINNSIELKVNY